MAEAITILKQWKKECWEFALAKVSSGTAFNRYHEERDKQLRNWYRGKLAERAIIDLLRGYGVPFRAESLFELFGDRFTGDKFDIMLYPNSGKITLDVKSIFSDGCLLIPLEHMKDSTDYFIGYEFNEDGTQVLCFGYVSATEIRQHTEHSGYAVKKDQSHYWFPRDRLHSFSTFLYELENFHTVLTEPVDRKLEEE
jgi:hypothetical protein